MTEHLLSIEMNDISTIINVNTTNAGVAITVEGRVSDAEGRGRCRDLSRIPAAGAEREEAWCQRRSSCRPWRERHRVRRLRSKADAAQIRSLGGSRDSILRSDADCHCGSDAYA